MVSRRQMLAAGGIAAAAGGVAGGWALLRQDSSRESGDIRIMSGPDQSRGNQRRRLLERWGQLHPEHPAALLEVAGVADAHRSEMVARAQRDDPGIDIYNLDVTWIAEFAEAGYIRPLAESGLDRAGFLEQPWESCRYDEELWALPFNTDAGLLYLRSDLVPEATGVPQALRWIEPESAQVDTIEYWVDQALAVPGRPEGLAGFTGQYEDYEGLTANALEIIWAKGGEVLAGDWREPVIDLDRMAGQLQWLARAFTDRNRSLFLPAATGHDEADSIQAFQAGRVVFMRNWPVASRALLAPDEAGATAPEFTVHRLPAPGVLGGQNLAIARGTPRPRAAQALIEFLTGTDQQRVLLREGGLAATRRELYDEPGIMGYPNLTVLRESIEQARWRPVTPYYARFSETFRAGVRAAIRNDGRVPDGFTERLAEALRGART